MQKLLKISSVSILAIVAGTNANGAGYTCEELVEYTSCNDGYYLNNGECIERSSCPSGSYLKVTCPADDYMIVFDSAWNMNEAYGDLNPNIDWESESTNGITTAWCYDYNMSHDYLVELPTIECTACPSIGITDKDGNTVTVKSEPGSFGIGACYIDPNAYFTDTKGTYHYTSNCSSVTYGMTLDEISCAEVGGLYLDGQCAMDTNRISMPQSECERAEANGSPVTWIDEEKLCYCNDGSWINFGDELSCAGM